MSVAIIIGEHRCPRYPNDQHVTRLQVEFIRPDEPTPYAYTQSNVKCLDCGHGIAFDLIYDVTVQKTVSVHVGS